MIQKVKMKPKYSLKQLKDRLKELMDELYYPADEHGVRRVKPTDLLERIVLFEQIETIKTEIKKRYIKLYS